MLWCDFVIRFQNNIYKYIKLVQLRQTTTPTTGMNKLKSTAKKKNGTTTTTNRKNNIRTVRNVGEGGEQQKQK